jgi:hypothetical protein
VLALVVGENGPCGPPVTRSCHWVRPPSRRRSFQRRLGSRPALEAFLFSSSTLIVAGFLLCLAVVPALPFFSLSNGAVPALRHVLPSVGLHCAHVNVSVLCAVSQHIAPLAGSAQLGARKHALHGATTSPVCTRLCAALRYVSLRCCPSLAPAGPNRRQHLLCLPAEPPHAICALVHGSAGATFVATTARQGNLSSAPSSRGQLVVLASIRARCASAAAADLESQLARPCRTPRTEAQYSLAACTEAISPTWRQLRIAPLPCIAAHLNASLA